MPTFRMIDLVRDRELLDVAHREASRWFDATKPSPTAVNNIVTNWSQRFRLIEIG
jgi:RecG-like helicase